MLPTVCLTPLPASLFPSLPPPPSPLLASVALPPPPLSLLTALLSPVTKGGLAVNGLNRHTQMHKLIHHTEAKLREIDRQTTLLHFKTILIHSTLKARLELIWRGISRAGCRQRQSAVLVLFCD